MPDPTSPSPDDEPSPMDVDERPEIEHVRNAWLRQRAVSEIDMGNPGGYAWDPTSYIPIVVEEEGRARLLFARQPVEES